MAWPDFHFHNGSLHEQFYRKQQENDRKCIQAYIIFDSAKIQTISHTFEKNTSFLHLFVKKYSKNSNIVK